MEVTNAKRVFVYDGQELPDPGQHLSPDEVMSFYSNQYPEITTATINTGEFKNDRLEFTIKRTMGTKG